MNDIDYYNEFEQDVKNSSNLRLTRELIRWDMNDHQVEIKAIIDELLTRENAEKTLNRLFLICFIYSNIFTVYTEHFYVFDEDEKETRRQLKNGWQGHLFALIVILVISLIYTVISVILCLGYLIFTLKWTIDWYKPIAEKIKTTANKSN